MKKHVLITILLGALVVNFPIAFSEPPVMVATVTYEGKTVNTDGTSTWMYRVTHTSGAAVSHSGITFGTCIIEDSIVSVKEDGVEIPKEVVKGDGGWSIDKTNLIHIPPIEPPELTSGSRLYEITLNGNYEELRNQLFVINGGDTELKFYITGPGCPQIPIPEIPFGTIAVLVSSLLGLAIFSTRSKLRTPFF